MPENVPDPLNAAEIQALGLKAEPVGPPTFEIPSGPLSPWNWCQLAWAGFWRAWWTWHNVLGFDADSYKVGTRALTRKAEILAYNALQHAIDMVNRLCPGQLPPGLADMSGSPLSFRGIITDT